MSNRKYRNYFMIDEGYFPAVNEDVIREQPNVWKSYYPHESFIQLLKQTQRVLTNNQRMSIWVEGAYGTGKSHAVLTLKKLLDCSNEDLKEYFSKYKNVFTNNDLYNEFYNIKNQSKKILTVHRYGSSEVRNEKVLIDLIQSSIINSLKISGYTYLGGTGIRQSIIDWLSQDYNKDYFNNLIKKPVYRSKFASKDADEIVENLKNYNSETALHRLIEDISFVGEEEGIKPFTLTKEALKDWIVDVIDKNNIKAVLFIWDEFSDYFSLNKGNLSGFQFMVEMSETYPFYFIIVTHKSDIFFENSDENVKKKINGRFISPHCSIELPDNMAFTLTGEAMKIVEDNLLASEWRDTVEDLYEATFDSRDEVIKSARIDDKLLKKVLPIHPYAALVLKHIASAFDSNQRSMFDFIKNDRGDEIKGFQWFIDNYGPDDNEAFLTVDLLWDFFYEKGKDQLSHQIRTILDVYKRVSEYQLTAKEKRVLKTILLLQAINEKVGDSVSLFIPNAKNLRLAFNGTEIQGGNACSIADKLVLQEILFKRPMGGGAEKYSALISNSNIEEINKEKEKFKKDLRTTKLLEEAEFLNDFKLPKNLEKRFGQRQLLTQENFKIEIGKIKESVKDNNTLAAVFVFARDESENLKLRTEIKKVLEEGNERIVFIDYSSTTINKDLLNQYITEMANGNYMAQKDRAQSKVHFDNAKVMLRKWKNEVNCAYPLVFTANDLNGTMYNSKEQVFLFLKEFDKNYFPLALELHLNVLDTMYAANALKQGAECGITKELKGTFKSSNDNTRLEKQLNQIWDDEYYWKNSPSEVLSKMKIAIEEVILEKIDKNSRVSIDDIYEVLEDEPFGILPCNLTAFVLGFLLREYANDSYNWTDDLTTAPMTVEKLKEMIDEIIKQKMSYNNKLRTKYIVAMSKEQRQFNKSTAQVFAIDESKCTSIENTRSLVRERMNSYRYPIWALNYLDDSHSLEVSRLIDLYVELANNMSLNKSETDIALEIGAIYIKNPNSATELKKLLNQEKCLRGMLKYLEVYKNGELANIAKRLEDRGAYVNEINKKFTDESNWVWNKTTVNEKIDETIVEYKIVDVSNKYLMRTYSYGECLDAWEQKIDNLKIPYLAVKNESLNLSEFLSALYSIKKNHVLSIAEKNRFLTLLMQDNSAIKGFLDSQFNIIKKVCEEEFKELNDSDINEILKQVHKVFDEDYSVYKSKIKNLVITHKKNKSKYRLIEMWKKNTLTESPNDWAEINSMPIFFALPVEEQINIRKMLGVINGLINEASCVDECLEYLTNFKYYENLKDKNYLDECFRNNILKEYSVLFNDINSIKNVLRIELKQIPVNEWSYELVNNKISSLAKEKYLDSEKTKAIKKIDSMDANKVKEYLKKLINDNMRVGIEILNDLN